MEEYIIVNKTAIQKRIEELEGYKDEPEITELKIYKEILSKSTPLIPEIEKAFGAGCRCEDWIDGRHDYTSQLKLDI